MIHTDRVNDRYKQDLDQILMPHENFLEVINAKHHIQQNKDSQIVVTFPIRDHLRDAQVFVPSLLHAPSTLYIHIPFCTGICSYCSYVTKKANTDDAAVSVYLDYLYREMHLWHVMIGNHTFDTCYIGGGTPTLLSAHDLERLIHQVKQRFNIKGEFTLEGSPETITFDRLAVAKDNGINRVSIGVESWNDHLLKKIGRRHTAYDAACAINMIKSCGFAVDIDLIRGLPGSNRDSLKHDALTSIELGLDSVTNYQYVSKHRSIDSKKYKSRYDFARDQIFLQHYFFSSIMTEHGYIEGPVDWFTKNDHEYSHNLLKWRDNAEQIALGVGSYGYVGGVSYHNTKQIKKYYGMIDNNSLPMEKSKALSASEQAQRHAIFGVKTGLDTSQWSDRYGVDFFETTVGKKVFELIDNQILTFDGRFIGTTKFSRLCSDDIQIWLSDC